MSSSSSSSSSSTSSSTSGSDASKSASIDPKKQQETKKDDKDKDKDERDDDTPIQNLVKATAPAHVVVHPLVLLSVVDHYTRVAKDTNRRVVGVLLGEIFKGKVDVTNSYAVPFEEDAKDPSVWYVDRQYHEDMYAMFKKVNAKEKVIGWYSTGPKIKENDIEINELFRAYTANPVLVIIDVNPKDALEIPTDAYYSVEARPEEKSQHRREFVHLPSEIGAYEAEEVGVEHLLRNIRETTGGTIADQVGAKLASLKALKNRMGEMSTYLDNVVKGVLPVNHKILYQLQDMFNLLPDLRVPQLVRAFAVKSNDAHLVIYVASLIRSITALHDLIDNKLSNRALELAEAQKQLESEQEKEKEKDSKDSKIPETETSTDKIKEESKK